MLVGPNKKETDIHDYHCLSSVDVRMRKVLATPLRSGAVNQCRSGLCLGVRTCKTHQ